MTGVHEVMALEERRRQALLAGDLPALLQLLAADMTYVHSTGACDRRDSYLAKLAGGSLRYLELDFAELQVQVLTQAATVTGRMTAAISKDGQRKHVTSLFMTVWARGVDGEWRLHAHQGTPLPAV
jgi:uncharacterized protein (TIGR02246 family)